MLALGAILGKLATIIVEGQKSIVEKIQHEVGDLLDGDDDDEEDNQQGEWA